MTYYELKLKTKNFFGEIEKFEPERQILSNLEISTKVWNNTSIIIDSIEANCFFVNLMITVLLFIIVLSLLVFVHEFGHFLAARKLGMRVYEFALGFPPMAIGVYRDPKTKKLVWVKGKKKTGRDAIAAGGGKETTEHAEYPATLYTLNWLPLGGFCKIKGENGEEGKEKDSFSGQKAWRRILVLVAGVTMNFLLAALLLGVGYMVGLPTDVSNGIDPKAQLVTQPSVIIQQVEKGTPADEAGLQFGDIILSLNNEAVKGSQDMKNYIEARASQLVEVKIERTVDGKKQQLTLPVTPRVLDQVDPKPKLGVILADAAIIRYPWYIAVYKGFSAAVFGLVNIFITFYFLLKGLILGQGLAFEVSGPVGIASVIGQSAKLGIQYLINVTAMISLSLAAMNILPIPALDGGRVFFVVLEKILRKPVPMKYEQIAHTIGFVLLLVLIVVVTTRDVIGLF